MFLRETSKDGLSKDSSRERMVKQCSISFFLPISSVIRSVTRSQFKRSRFFDSSKPLLLVAIIVLYLDTFCLQPVLQPLVLLVVGRGQSTEIDVFEIYEFRQS